MYNNPGDPQNQFLTNKLKTNENSSKPWKNKHWKMGSSQGRTQTNPPQKNMEKKKKKKIVNNNSKKWKIIRKMGSRQGRTQQIQKQIKRMEKKAASR